MVSCLPKSGVSPVTTAFNMLKSTTIFDEDESQYSASSGVTLIKINLGSSTPLGNQALTKGEK